MTEKKNEPMESKSKHKQGGISIGILDIILIMAAFVFSVILIVSTSQSLNSYQETMDATNAYTRAQRDTSKAEMASDKLTRLVREFVVTGEEATMDEYVNEASVFQQFENAVRELENLTDNTDTLASMQRSLEASQALISIECHAMHLMALAMGFNEEHLPEEVRTITLTEEELQLSDEAKKGRAQALAFSDEYQSYKEIVHRNLSIASEIMVAESLEKQETSSTYLQRVLQRQQYLIIGFLVIVMILILLNLSLMVNPVRKAARFVQAEERLPMKGSHELRMLIETYNNMYDKTQHDRERLSYEASHDGLTSLYNRHYFEESMEKCADSEAYALILLDVDHLKEFNDSNGHDMGDRVLIRVARALRSCFREYDDVCRIGGDEFCVIMKNMHSDMEHIVAKKMKRVRENLSKERDGIPAITISVGIAFKDMIPEGESLYKSADLALYQVKNSGRDGYLVYHPEKK